MHSRVTRDPGVAGGVTQVGSRKRSIESSCGLDGDVTGEKLQGHGEVAGRVRGSVAKRRGREAEDCRES